MDEERTTGKSKKIKGVGSRSAQRLPAPLATPGCALGNAFPWLRYNPSNTRTARSAVARVVAETVPHRLSRQSLVTERMASQRMALGLRRPPLA